MIRFFTYAMDSEGEVDMFEITEECFLEVGGVITYERHTVREHGTSQVCLTKEAEICYPDVDDLELIK